MDIIKTITDWPVIVQGALGSALFWLVLEVGQRIGRRASDRWSKDKWAANAFAITAHEASGEFAERARFMCMYAALHYLSKAAIVVVLAMTVSPVVDVFASVGYLIGAFFIFRALAVVHHTDTWGRQRIERFSTALFLPKPIHARVSQTTPHPTGVILSVT